MRSYFKCFRSPDFRTLLTEIPPGISGDELAQWQKLMVLLADAHEWVPPLYNRIALPAQWVGFDGESFPTWEGFDENHNPIGQIATGAPIDGDSGLTLANKLFDCRDYSEHPKN